MADQPTDACKGLRESRYWSTDRPDGWSTDCPLLG